MGERIWFVREIIGRTVRTAVRYSGTREWAVAYARSTRAAGRRAVVGWRLGRA